MYFEPLVSRVGPGAIIEYDYVKGDLKQGWFGFVRFSCLGFLCCVFQLA